ncbi:glucokinase [Beggiatoa leptomitoformis]|uniref:Glucokinase n=1 Tax=Beggiatoa leptomitoformis TaxID=288004 RepID=A0A2N9YHR2_9GAMM|nr:glucokinase [Beggiatoa leptomitoformis]ALG67673.1 glucokinase [Beggiatoa leptomitoformis]AUI70091.1 glucokinase [Beggiatoa leptomitoformis]
MILAGDIGATKTLLALYDENTMSCQYQASYVGQAYNDFYSLLDDFLQRTQPNLTALCLGIAGPVINGHCQTLNLPWSVNISQLQTQTNCQQIKLLNDLEAMAYGIQYLSADEYYSLTPSLVKRQGNIALIAAGTGLGEAFLYWDGTRHHVIASEGGHVDFAPRNDLEIELLRFLQQRFNHVSYERLLSGAGLQVIYDFLKNQGYAQESPIISQQLQQATDPSALISHFALTNSSTLCNKTLEIFTSLYGAEAGNMALKCLSYGGVYLGGGIAPKILAELQKPYFLNAFYEKGRYRVINEQIPIYIILNQQVVLLGAAWQAMR